MIPSGLYMMKVCGNFHMDELKVGEGSLVALKVSRQTS